RRPPERAETQRGGERHQDEARAELEVAAEDQRRDHRYEQSPERAARGDRQVEGGEALRRRARAVELAVAEKAGDEQPRQEDAELQRERVVEAAVGEQPGHAD